MSDDAVDPKAAIDAQCAAKKACVALAKKANECRERVEAKGSGDCSPQYFLAWSCIDHCAAHKLSKVLK